MKKLFYFVLLVTFLVLGSSINSFSTLEIPGDETLIIETNPGRSTLAYFIQNAIANDYIEFISEEKKNTFNNKLSVLIKTIDSKNHHGMAKKIENDLLKHVNWISNDADRTITESLLNVTIEIYQEKIDEIVYLESFYNLCMSSYQNNISLCATTETTDIHLAKCTNIKSGMMGGIEIHSGGCDTIKHKKIVAEK